MVLEDGVIRLKRKEENSWDESPWDVIIDLKEVAGYAGVRKKDKYNNTLRVDYPMSRAHKLLRFIVANGNRDDLLECESCFRKNERLYRCWRKCLDKSDVYIPGGKE